MRCVWPGRDWRPWPRSRRGGVERRPRPRRFGRIDCISCGRSQSCGFPRIAVAQGVRSNGSRCSHPRFAKSVLSVASMPIDAQRYAPDAMAKGVPIAGAERRGGRCQRCGQVERCARADSVEPASNAVRSGIAARTAARAVAGRRSACVGLHRLPGRSTLAYLLAGAWESSARSILLLPSAARVALRRRWPSAAISTTPEPPALLRNR